MYILGAGMAGCLAGVMFPEATVLERQPELPTNHSAVLRFRTDAISKATGIPFQRVQVHKAIWYEDEFVPVAPKYINEYAQKVTGGRVVPRSIASVTPDPETRYIAPQDFQLRLARMLGTRLQLGKQIASVQRERIHMHEIGDHQNRAEGGVVISTLPMPVMNRLVQPSIDVEFNHASIHVSVYIVPGCDIYQTVYYPDPSTPIYRASLTGDRLIVEATREPLSDHMVVIHRSLGLLPVGMSLASQSTQLFGKITTIDASKRKDFILRLTQELNIYSLGRFACWREGTMMDDVYKDIFQIRQMLNRHPYDGAIGKEA